MWETFLDSWAFGIVYPLSLLLSVIFGILFAIRYTKKKRWESSGIENSIIGIFGLIISFTFLTAGNAHRERYAFIHQEANAAELLYRYSKEMPDSFFLATKSFVTNFLQNQTGMGIKKGDSETPIVRNAILLFENYWAYKTAFERRNTDPVIARKLEKLSQYCDDLKSGFSRIAYSYNERTPSTVMYLLIVSSLLIGFLVGFMNGINTNVHYLVPLIYVGFVALIMMVIRDLNNPFGGIIKPNYQDLITLNQYILNHK